MIPKVTEELHECNIIDIRSRQRESFNDLIPEVEIPPEDYSGLYLYDQVAPHG